MGYAECSTRMWDYLSAMCDVYGPNFSGYPDDPEVWAVLIGQGHTHWGI
ncbi:hypothetical protein Hanom_Chr12g01113891 [Helianthus anomalus]